jgi:hypothetical protein
VKIKLLINAGKLSPSSRIVNYSNRMVLYQLFVTI